MSLLPSFTIAADGQEAVNNKLSRQSGYFSDLIHVLPVVIFVCIEMAVFLLIDSNSAVTVNANK